MDFLNNLPEVFKERYLNTHRIYLKSIADIIAVLYKMPILENVAINMVKKIQKQGASVTKKRKDTRDETIEFRNLRNSWYHECSLNYPVNDLNERLKFASWKIVQCYYSVFSSIASLVSCHCSPPHSHNRILSIYSSEFLCGNNRKDFFLAPVNLYLDENGSIPKELLDQITWSYAHTHKIPFIIESLEEIQNIQDNPSIVTIPHYLKSLREWATYQDSYLFFRLYGDEPKNDLSFSLKLITFIHCLQTEYYLINLFGWETVELQFERFLQELEGNLGISSPTLLARLEAYHRFDLK